MTDETLLSVIVPVYNSAAYLPRCVDSILAAGIGGLLLWRLIPKKLFVV